MNRSIILLIIAIFTFINGQDNSVVVKTKDGKTITGVITGGGLDDYYIQIKTKNNKYKNVYTDEISSISEVIENDTKEYLEKKNNKRSIIPEIKDSNRKSDKLNDLINNDTDSQNLYSKPDQINNPLPLNKYALYLGGVSGIFSLYYHFSANKDYTEYQDASKKQDIIMYREDTKSKDSIRNTSFMISSASLIYYYLTRNKVEGI